MTQSTPKSEIVPAQSSEDSLAETRLDSPTLDTETPTPTVTYAGFWKRVVAFMIDYIVMMIFVTVFSFVMGMVMAHNGIDANADDTLALFDALMQVTVLMFAWLYFGLMESSKQQATLGKLLIGLQVTDLEGQRISFLRASGRHFGKYVSLLLATLGFLMVAFTRRKQGLHDKMARCLVVNHTH